MKRRETTNTMISTAGGKKYVGYLWEDAAAGDVGTNDDVALCQTINDAEPK